MEGRRANSWSSGHEAMAGPNQAGPSGSSGPGMPHRHSIPLTPTLPSISDLHESPQKQTHTLPHYRSAGSAGSSSRSPEDQARGLGQYGSGAGQGRPAHPQGDSSAWFLGGSGSSTRGSGSGTGAGPGVVHPPPLGDGPGYEPGRGSGEWGGDRPGTAQRPETSGSIVSDFHPGPIYPAAHPGTGDMSYNNSSRGPSSQNRMSLTGGLLNPMPMDDYDYPPFHAAHASHPSHAAPPPPPFETRLSGDSAVGTNHGSRGFDALLEGLDAAAHNGIGNGSGIDHGNGQGEDGAGDGSADAGQEGGPKRPKGGRSGSGGKRGSDFDDGSEEYKRKKNLLNKGLVSECQFIALLQVHSLRKPDFMPLRRTIHS